MSGRPASALEDFHDAVRVNADALARVRKIEKKVAILARAEITAAFEIVFVPVVQADHKRTKRLPLHHPLNLLNFHGCTVAGSREMNKPGPPCVRPRETEGKDAETAGRPYRRR